jgi:hypothetical protein
MKKSVYFILLAAMPFLTGANHPFYFSVTELEYSSSRKEVGISCKVFPDDMEETLRLFTQKKFDLSVENNQEISAALTSYFKKHLGVKVNGKPKDIIFLGYQNDKEATWIYFNIPKVAGVTSIELSTDLMYEYREEQTNIIHLNIDQKRESFKLTSPNTTVSIAK